MHPSTHRAPADAADDDDPARPERVLAERWPQLYGEIVRYVSHLGHGDAHAAEDVAQETVIRLWQCPELLSPGRPLSAWLRTVARNIVIDRARRRRARPTEVALGPGVDRASRDDLEWIEAADSVTALLSGLSPRHRSVVLEVYVRDRSIADVARDLGIPTGTVKSRCHTALRQLRTTVPRPRTIPRWSPEPPG